MKMVGLYIWFKDGSLAYWLDITEETAEEIINDLQKSENYLDHFIEKIY